jgi:thiol-disulfide isomerase/thioredoxin
MFLSSSDLMKVFRLIALLLLAPAISVHALDAPKSDTPKPGEPTDAKARKTYEAAIEWLQKGAKEEAIDSFRKANKQDGGHCTECLRRAYTLAIAIGQYKDAENIAREWLPAAANDTDRATVHYRIALALQQQGIAGKKEKCFDESCDEFKTALQLEPGYTPIHYALGISLANLHQDDAARTEFSTFLDKDSANPAIHARASRFLDRIELARSRMAPPFSVTTLDGQNISMDALAGKVVLIDFWATWCGPCREALPHVRDIARRFQGQPFVVLSVSLDKDMEKWRSFVNKNEMTWMQYRDGGFDGSLAKLFGVTAIPATFTIDADGVLEDQHVGDADIEGKLKKLIARANEVANRKSVQAAAQVPSGAN